MVNTKQNRGFKQAVIDQIVLWIVLFISFVTLFFMILDYSAVARIKGNTDVMAEYAARMIALGDTEAEVATKLNNVKLPYFANISAGDINCITSVGGVNDEYQVRFEITSTYSDTKVLTFTNNIESIVTSFNETGSDYIECTLTLTKN